MTFKNLSFTDHPVIPGAIQAAIICNNGKRISIVAGTNLYSHSKGGIRAAVDNPEEVISFEVLVEGEEDVRGFQSRQDIDNILAVNNL